MSSVAFSQPELIRVAKLSITDLTRIRECRHPHTRLGFAYQLAFVRLANRFPAQEPLEMVNEISTYVNVQLDIAPSAIHLYAQQRRTIINHQQEICDYLQLRRFGESEVAMLETFLFEEACRMEQTGPLLVRAKSFLQENNILFPADSSLRRLIAKQRQRAREHIYQRVMDGLTPELMDKLDALLTAGATRLTPFQSLKQPPGRPSPAALLRLTDKLDQIRSAGILSLDLSWLNNNYQRMLARYACRCSADRVRDLHKQRIYLIDTDRDYGPLTPLIRRWDRTIHLDWISEQWDRMGQFYASLESGHTTASTALKRLNSFSEKNHFYRANRELGRIFKTEFILQFLSDPVTRQRVRRGLLKGEEIHALARQVAYGKQGVLTASDLEGQRHTSSCLTLIMACIVYWQAKEINRVLLEKDPEGARVDLSLLEHISPIGWENTILYGEYVLNRNLVRA